MKDEKSFAFALSPKMVNGQSRTASGPGNKAKEERSFDVRHDVKLHKGVVLPREEPGLMVARENHPNRTLGQRAVRYWLSPGHLRVKVVRAYDVIDATSLAVASRTVPVAGWNPQYESKGDPVGHHDVKGPQEPCVRKLMLIVELRPL